MQLKKIFLGMGIFFMTALLLLAVTISPKLFSPENKVDITTNTNISQSKVKDVYESFSTYKTEYSNRLLNLKETLTLEYLC